MRPLARRPLVLAGAFAIATAACTADDAPLPGPRPLGLLELEPCPREYPRVSCATIEVPQVHAEPLGRKLTLHVFVARGIDSGREPVVYLAGGPGGSVAPVAEVGAAAYFAGALGRDVILLEQRGVSLSRPALACDLAVPDGETTDEGPLRACVEKYAAEGIRLEAFNTLESAHDVEDLRRAIDRDKVILWGSSYGALLADVVAREHPDGVAALVLESSVLSDRPYRPIDRWKIFRSKIAAFAEWLKTTCAAAPRCAAAYPGLDPAAEIARAAERAAAAPIQLTQRLLIDSLETLEIVLLHAMYYTPHATLLVRALWADNRGELEQFDRDVWIDGLGAREYLDRALDLGARISSATLRVVNCYDLERNWTDEGIARATAEGLSPEEATEVAEGLAASRKGCAVLPPPTFEQARFTAAKPVAAPTLFLGGALDATTPVEWAEADRSRFSRAQVVSFPCMGHGVAFAAPECSATVLSQLVGRLASFGPETSLDTSCVARECDPAVAEGGLFLEDRSRR